MYIEETYANGDGTDSWCSNHAQLPTDMYKAQTYAHPTTGISSCGMVVMQTKIPVYIELYSDTQGQTSCTNRDFNYFTTNFIFFLCMK
jgi:hypothetical protein